MVQTRVKIIALILFTQTCFALSDDRMQIMKLSAGSADLDQQAHRGIYTDNVQLDQGTTHIRAAKAITEGNAKNQLIKAIINGNKTTQAHYWTLASANKPPVHAYADCINYCPKTHLIELIGNARVEQGADSFSAPKISYDTLDQHVITQNNGQGRTTIVIHPGEHP